MFVPLVKTATLYKIENCCLKSTS